MTAGTMLAVFEDFNEPRVETAPLPAEEPDFLADGTAKHQEEAWTDGYMTGRRERRAWSDDPALTAKLLTSVHELESKTSSAVHDVALILAEMLANTVITISSDEWSARLLERVQLVADRIKPALTIAPQFELRDAAGIVRHFSDISEVSRALEVSDVDQDVSIRWQHGEATINRKALLEDLREAIIPLSTGLADQQVTGKHS